MAGSLGLGADTAYLRTMALTDRLPEASLDAASDSGLTVDEQRIADSIRDQIIDWAAARITCGRVLCRNRAGFLVALSYLLSYPFLMAQRQKRSISLPSDLADAIDQAATAQGTTVSAWIAETAAHRLRIDAGRQGVAEWERQHGALTPDELADGLARARAMLRRQPSRKSA